MAKGGDIRTPLPPPSSSTTLRAAPPSKEPSEPTAKEAAPPDIMEATMVSPDGLTEPCAEPGSTCGDGGVSPAGPGKRMRVMGRQRQGESGVEVWG